MESLPMNDLGTGAEHMSRLYLWRVSKRGQRVHILDSETSRTFCQVEKCGGKPFDGSDAEVPAGRRVCGNCIDLEGRNEAKYQEPNIKVLMGERLAETEPELFTSAAAPEPWKRKKQMRPAHGGKPKRSEVKYPRPFNDDLPW